MTNQVPANVAGTTRVRRRRLRALLIECCARLGAGNGCHGDRDRARTCLQRSAGRAAGVPRHCRSVAHHQRCPNAAGGLPSGIALLITAYTRMMAAMRMVLVVTALVLLESTVGLLAGLSLDRRSGSRCQDSLFKGLPDCEHSSSVLGRVEGVMSERVKAGGDDRVPPC